MGIAHITFDLGSGNERGDRIDNDQFERIGANQHLDDLERLLSRVGLRHEKVIEIDSETTGIGRIESVLGIDESGDPTVSLRAGNHVKRQRGFS